MPPSSRVPCMSLSLSLSLSSLSSSASSLAPLAAASLQAPGPSGDGQYAVCGAQLWTVPRVLGVRSRCISAKIRRAFA